MANHRSLGRSPITISPIGLGCWQFSEGRGFAGRFWPALSQATANQIVAASLDAGINWFDTAEVYGGGRSEAALARALTAAGKKNGDVVAATKWWPMWRTAGNIKATIGARLASLTSFGIDLYQIHQPFALASTAAQMHAMADLVEDQQIRTVGVSNFSAAKMRAAHQALATHFRDHGRRSRNEAAKLLLEVIADRLHMRQEIGRQHHVERRRGHGHAERIAAIGVAVHHHLAAVCDGTPYLFAKDSGT